MVNIGAVWASIPNNHLAAYAAATTTYVAFMLSSYRTDMFTARAAAEAQTEDKRPVLMTRPSIAEWMAKEDARITEGTRPMGAFNARMNKESE